MVTLGTRQLSKQQEQDGIVLSKGTLLQDRYEIIRVVAMGGMSIVYQARDRRFSNVTKVCAVKEMINSAPDPHLRELAIQNFEREANILATLSHPAVPKIFDYFSEGNRSYLVMEFIEGQDLETVLNQTPDFIPEQKIIEWALQICDVLDYLHSFNPPIIYRDIKPSNVMLDRHERIMLVDFGIAKVFQTGQKGTMIGTEGYSPPEQYRGAAEPRGDLYALGATMHHLLTKRDPRLEPPFSFHERPIRSFNPQVSEGLEAVVMRALEYDVEKRFSSAKEMQQALLQVAPSTQMATELAPTVAFAVRGEAGGIQPLWTFKCEDEVRSSPAVVDGVLYVGAYDNNLWAIDAQKGEFIWKYPTEGGIASSPGVWKDLVLFGSEDRLLYAVFTHSGRIAWTCPTQDRIRSSPRVAMEHVFFGSDDRHLYNVSARSGRMVWKFEAVGPIRSSPTIVEEIVYIGAQDYCVYALNIQDGSVKWKFRTNRPVISSPTFFEGLVLIGSMDCNLYALDASSGWAVWRYRTGGHVISTPAIDANLGLAFVGSADGNMYAVDLRTGRLAWKYTTGDQVISSPALFEGAVYFGSVDGCVYSLDARSGELRWNYKTEGIVVSSPAVVEGVVYIGSADHRIYALPA
ncbi:MAG: serine/threonine-protein kinase [Anaerolineae bacterium]|jgi:outer membrane protein assembly factor BamB/tRNA A-37 threonylcarbamoyl transferase component Bud32|nr:serine/threonine-protein kinase [Anaerolineae bacterium]